MEDILMAGREKRVERSWEIPEIHGIPICSLHDTINAFSLLVTQKQDPICNISLFLNGKASFITEYITQSWILPTNTRTEGGDYLCWAYADI
jgi:hypothetical protein